MFGKVNPALAVSKSIRMVVTSLPEPLKHAETIKNISFCCSKAWPPTRFLIFCYVAFYFTCTARPGCTFEQPGLKNYCFFVVSASFFLYFGVALSSCFASWARECTHLRPWKSQTDNWSSKGIAKVIFRTPPWSVFGQLFVIFLFFHGLEVFVKIEPPLRRELNFESPEPSKCHFFSPEAPSKN